MRKLTILFSVAVISAILLSAGATRGTRANKNMGGVVEASSAAPSKLLQDPSAPIDGAATPHLIPDTVAYGLFFDFFTDRAPEERGRLQSYCAQTGLANVDLDALFAAAAYYRQRTADFDARAEAVRNAGRKPGADPAAVAAQMGQLREERETVVSEVIVRLPELLGAEGALAVRRHINERVKPRTKIVPGPPQTPESLSGRPPAHH